MTSHRKRKPGLFAKMSKLRPQLYLPSVGTMLGCTGDALRTLFGCTADGRILWVKVGYMTSDPLDNHER
jgi:hypothetical protein